MVNSRERKRHTLLYMHLWPLNAGIHINIAGIYLQFSMRDQLQVANEWQQFVGRILTVNFNFSTFSGPRIAEKNLFKNKSIPKGPYGPDRVNKLTVQAPTGSTRLTRTHHAQSQETVHTAVR